MNAPRLRAFTRQCRPSTLQCLRQPAAQRPPRSPFRNPFQQQQRRHQSGRTTWQATKSLFYQYPISVSFAFGIILFGAGTLIYSNYIYNTYIIGAFHKFPEPVAKELRKALYYTNISLDPKLALKHYKLALQVAEEVGMDPFSDEVLGVKIQVGALMEKIQQYKKAIEVLELVRNDCLRWVNELGSKPGNEGRRTQILGKTVGISVKLGELYGNEYVLDKEAAEEKLVWAVTTVLKEQQRREREGVKEGEGMWMSPEQIGGSLEALGHHYEEKNQHYLAAPLFLNAVALSPPSSCHTAVLMNNLSISLAQQSPPSTPGQPAPSRPALIANAREWANKALAVAAKIQPPERDEECDVGCAVATHNLGEFAEMDGDIREARRRYGEARGLAEAVGFTEGIANADEALRRIDSKA